MKKKMESVEEVLEFLQTQIVLSEQEDAHSDNEQWLKYLVNCIKGEAEFNLPDPNKWPLKEYVEDEN